MAPDVTTPHAVGSAERSIGVAGPSLLSVIAPLPSKIDYQASQPGGASRIAYHVDAGVRDIDDALHDLLSVLPSSTADAILDDLMDAFQVIEDINSRFRALYQNLRLASLMLDDLRPDHPIDALDGHYDAAVVQGQTMPALLAVTMDILERNGIDISGLATRIQSDRYLLLRKQRHGSAPLRILICDELARFGTNLRVTFDRADAHFDLKEGDEARALVAQYIDRDAADADKQAIDYHINVAQVLGTSLRPHSTASCFSKPVALSRQQYAQLVGACLAADPDILDPATAHAGPVTWTDAPPWDTTDPECYWGNGVTRLTSLLSGKLIDELIEKIGLPCASLLADAHVDWHILFTNSSSVQIRFAPQVILNSLELRSLRTWIVTITHYDAPAWTDDHYKAAADMLRLILSSVVFDIWSVFVAQSLPEEITLERDTEALRLIVGDQLAPCILSPYDNIPRHVGKGESLFSDMHTPPVPVLDSDDLRNLKQPFPCPFSQNTAEALYDMLWQLAPRTPEGDHRAPVSIHDILCRLQSADKISALRADLALFVATASDAWIRMDWCIEHGFAVPALRLAEVAPRFQELPGPAPRMSGIISYADLPDVE